MSTTTITTALADQYARQWDMLRATIERIDDAAWHAGVDHAVPAWIALHTVIVADFYLQTDLSTFDRSARLGVSDREPGKPLPGRAALREYLDEVAARTDAFLRGLDDAALFAAETLFPWTGANVFERTVYMLRHTTYHLGELSYVLRLHGAEATEWA